MAAKKSDTGAQFSLGFMAANGIGGEQDLSAARRWYEQAADSGHGAAQHNLAFMYYRGEGVGQDLT